MLSHHSVCSALFSMALVLSLLPASTEPSWGQAQTPPATGKEDQAQCTDDAMLVFDASGSMAGADRIGIAGVSGAAKGNVVTRIDTVRKALAKVLPVVAPNRRIGLVTYGPGPYDRCDNIELKLRPAPNAAAAIMEIITPLNPAGQTPLTAAVEKAAEVLDFRNKPGTIVLLTDGEETCGGNPCKLAKIFQSEGKQLTVHVIGYRIKDFSWTGGQGMMDTRCLSGQNGGTYTSVETADELSAALLKTLSCPMLTQAGP